MNRENRQKWQADLSRCVGQAPNPDVDLVTGIDMGATHFAAVKEAARRYVCASFECDPDTTSEEAINAKLNAEMDSAANRTPNGALVPKTEFEREYNELHRAVAAWLTSLNMSHLMASIRCPIVVRAVKGIANDSSAKRPYAASKMHVDLWAGDPPDGVAVIIPFLGDLENTTIEWYRPPQGFEEQYLTVMDSYDIAREIESECTLYPLEARMGDAYFIDAIVMHRTVIHGGGARVNLQFDIRRPLSKEESLKMDPSFNTGRLDLYVDPEAWLSYGSARLLRFADTNADAKRGIYRKHQDDQRTYEVADAPELEAATLPGTQG